MKRTLLTLGVAAMAVATGCSTFAQSLLYGLTRTNSLTLFSASGGPVLAGPALSGIASGESVIALDFRPLTGELYALSRDAGNQGRIYTVDPATGAASPVALNGPSLEVGGAADLDFNPVAVGGVNALRIVTSEGRNYRLVFDANGATVNVDGTLNVAGGASATNVVATAYTNNRGGLPGGGGLGGTAQYALDSATDTLYRVNPPNAGTLTNALPLGVDLESTPAALDITTGANRALALLRVAGVNGLYDLSLSTGTATLLRPLPDDLVGFAAPLPAVFPSVMVYGLTDTNSLVSFPADESPVAPGPALAGLGAGETAVALDFRPFNGALYVLTRDATELGRLYTVDATSGAAVPVVLGGGSLNLTGSVDMDFNPAAVGGTNALRIITGSGQNYRLVFTSSGATVNVDGAMNRAGATELNVIATAYANNRSGLPGGGGVGGTVQYAIDAASDTLFRVNPPNAGTLVEPRPLTLEVGSVGGLDVVTGLDRALAVLQVGAETGLYEIDLPTGATAFLRALPTNVVDAAVAIPVSVTPLERTEGSVQLRWSGGVGPFAVQRGDQVTDPFCSVTVATNSPVLASTDGGQGFFRVADLAGAPTTRLTVALSGAAERPTPVTTTASGSGTLELAGDLLSFQIEYRDLSGPAVAAHLHGPSSSEGSSGVLVDLGPFNGGQFGISGMLTGQVAISTAVKAALLGGRVYVNIHTAAHAGGEIRGQVTPTVLLVGLSGAAERPEPVASDATGLGRFTLQGRELRFRIEYRGLSGPATAAHLHGPASGSGTAGVLLDLAPFNGGAFGTEGAFAGSVLLTDAQLGALADGAIYVNIHTAAHPGGEVRGQILPNLAARSLGAELTGAAERPNPVETSATGFGSFALDGDQLTFRIVYRGFSGPVTAAHLHGPANASGTAGVLFDLAPFHRGVFGTSGIFAGSVRLQPQHKAALLNGEIYVNLHTAMNPAGEIRGQVLP